MGRSDLVSTDTRGSTLTSFVQNLGIGDVRIARTPSVSGEWLLRRMIRGTSAQQHAIGSRFIVPCIRREKGSRIDCGSHLSLFHLFLLFAPGQNAAIDFSCMLSEILNKLARNVGVMSNTGRYNVRAAKFAKARDFPFVASGCEMVGLNGIEVATIVGIYSIDDRHTPLGVACGIGIERLLMVLMNCDNIWDISFFQKVRCLYGSVRECDQARLRAFLGCESECTEVIKGTLL